jgi:hypothetical protein
VLSNKTFDFKRKQQGFSPSGEQLQGYLSSFFRSKAHGKP